MDRKRALITGGGSGIGLSIARRFQENSIDVVIAGRNPKRLAETGLAFVEMDVSDEASVKAAIAKAGRVDILVANAGSAETAPALKTPTALWERMIAVNLTGAFLCAREGLKPMVERGWGRFIVIASTASLKGYAYTAAYSAAKHGVLGLVRSLAAELAKTGVTANAICPGFTDTELVARSLDTIVARTGKTREEALGALVKDNPMGRLIDPGEVASAALWLASGGAASVNGQTIVIDGGETAA